MGTHALIGAQFDSDVVGESGIVASYCHYDGYLNGAGFLLYTEFSGDNAYAVADHGYFSSLPKNLDELQNETDGSHANSDEAVYLENETEFLECGMNQGCDYAYLWRDGVWYFVEYNSSDEFPQMQELTEEILMQEIGLMERRYKDTNTKSDFINEMKQAIINRNTEFA
jgi:hypothetical protein